MIEENHKNHFQPMGTYVPDAASIRYSLCASTQTISPAHIITLTGQHHLKGKTKKIIWELCEQAGWGFSAKRGFALGKVAESSEGWDGRRLTSGNSFTSGSIRTDHQGDSPTFHKGFLRFSSQQ